MTTKIQRWGNSLALRIPGSFAKDTHLAKGSEVNISIESGRIVIEPAFSRKYPLTHLLKRIKKGIVHAEIDPGKNVGREIW
jgi:antitoxin MazE